MKLKTLLMGSAASLIAVSGAYAADAVVAEPEPMDYVKVCDMYGAGFFYIPGTETCLKINGYVDVQYEYSQIDNSITLTPTSADEWSQSLLDLDTTQNVSEDFSTGEPVYLARVNFDAREETDYGTMRSYVRMEGSGGNSGGAALRALDVYISLGGFSSGYRTTALETGGLAGLMLDGYYGGGRHMYANYTYAANGFALIAGVDLDNGASLSAGSIDGIYNPNGSATENGVLPNNEAAADWSMNNAGNAGDSKSVNPYVVASYTGSMFTIRGKYGHDTSASEDHYGVDGSVTPIDGLTIRGFWEGNSGVNEYSFSADPTGFWSKAGYAFCGDCSESDAATVDGLNLYAEQNWGIGATFALMDNLSIAAGYSKAEFDGSDSSGDGGEIDSYSIGLDWNVTNNLLVRVNYRHQDWNGFADSSSGSASGGSASAEVDELRVRVRRSF